MSNWEDTIDVQLAIRRHMDLNARARGIMPEEERGVPRDEEFARRVVTTVWRWLGVATPIYVAPDMTAVWMAAEREFQPEPFRESDLLVETGFALLPEAVPINRLMTDNDPSATEETGEVITLQVRALAWGPAQWGGQDVALIGLGFPNEQPETADFGAERVERDYWLPIVHDGLVYGQSFERHDNMIRAFQAFFALLRQFVPQPERLPRARRRAAEREGKPGEVKIMRLRRVRSDDHSEPSGETVNWRNQWVVSGHWRNQPCGPANAERRQVFIAPYVKGPEDKPLRDPSRVLELLR